jgi:SagB-type dehydrogenase family enzyme
MRYEGRHFKRFARTGRFDGAAEGSMLCEIFHENSKLTPLAARTMRAEVALFDRAARLMTRPRSPRKVYSLADTIELPDGGPPADALERAIAGRPAAPAFSGAAVTRPELARLLLYSYGFTPPGSGCRAVASGGSLYPLELYAVAWKVEDLEPAVYHYDPASHRLDVVARGDFLPRLSQCVWLDDVDAASAALVLVITAFFARSTIKYRERGYRMVLMEAGQVAQNLGLLATAQGLASRALDGFLDNELSALIGADGFAEAALLPVIVGRAAEPAPAAGDRTAGSGGGALAGGAR